MEKFLPFSSTLYKRTLCKSSQNLPILVCIQKYSICSSQLETTNLANTNNSMKSSLKPRKTYPGKFNLLKTLQREEQYRLDVDGRSSLFSIGSRNYCPSGSLLRVFYYSYPFSSGLQFPLTPIKSDENVYHLWDDNGKLPVTPRIEFPMAKDKVLNSNPPSSFWGLLIYVHRNSVDSTFLLRNIVDDVPVEMTFQMFSPLIVGIQMLRRGKQGRSRIYWMRDRPLTWIYKKDFPTETELNATNPFTQIIPDQVAKAKTNKK